ncbi:hypothetical protein K7432_004934 [Basidiobolus ranarum]|uniref:Uncharacterized protein n=1 Tax=Basidiobolus ranarum TaxID=34480 RepID=A0ABR2W3W2_9FUNG
MSGYSRDLPPSGGFFPPGQNGQYMEPPPQYQQKPKFEWVHATDGSVPPNAVQGGIEADGKPLFIARQYYQGGLHPGKAAPHLKGLAIGYAGKEITLKEYYVLCGDARQLRWIECKGPVRTDSWKPIEGCEEKDGKPLYVAKVRTQGGEHLGKTGPHLKGGMNYSYGGKEKTHKDTYYVLAYL